MALRAEIGVKAMENKEVILAEIEANRIRLHNLVDARFDGLREAVLSGSSVTMAEMEYEYPLCAPPYLFKGSKPIAVLFGEERVELNSWRKVYTEILRRCTVEKHDVLMELRNKISGRERIMLSDKPDSMNAPIKLSDNLFAEAYFDTEWLIRILTNRILDAVCFDYSHISIVLKPPR